jgi:hypothetical protein
MRRLAAKITRLALVGATVAGCGSVSGTIGASTSQSGHSPTTSRTSSSTMTTTPTATKVSTAQATFTTSSTATAPASNASSGAGPATITKCGLDGVRFADAAVDLHGVKPGDYYVYVDFIEGGVFAERVVEEISVTSSGQQTVKGVLAGSHQLTTAPQCVLDSVWSQKNYATSSVKLWSSHTSYSSQSPEYP